MASRLLEFLMQNASHSNRQIFKNNLEIIKTLVECWRNKLNIPTKYIIIYVQIFKEHNFHEDSAFLKF